MARRDRLFALCTPAEQRRLVAAAQWYDAHDPRLLAMPSIFTESHAAMFYHRHLPFLGSKPPGLLTRVLAKVANAINKVETWRGQRVQDAFLAYLAAIGDEGAADELLVVVHFMRLLPVRIGFEGTRNVERLLDALAAECAYDARVPVLQRFAAVQRCKLWPIEATGWMTPRDLGLHVWRLLLQLADEHAGTALRVIDEHWEGRTSPQLLGSLDLHADPQLAYQLSIKFKPHRADFAAAMLGTSIGSLSRQLSTPPAAAADTLQHLMDASCLLLARWTLEDQCLGIQAELGALHCLFRFGEPAQPYWYRLPARCMALLLSLQAEERAKQLSLLACVVFYTERSDPVATEALALLKALCSARMSAVPDRPPEHEWAPTLETTISDVCQATLALLEDKVLSGRNRHVPAQPDHPLLHTVEDLLDKLLERVMGAEPQKALSRWVSGVRGLSHEGLLRKHHRLFREGFERRAQAFPDDAGLALKRLVQYCGFSQVDDEMYKKELCRESFDLLVPVLEAISPEHAAVARTGVGWSPRGNL